ncbi:FapA family protein [Bacillus sp. Marseille-P3661]|uniref:FapA family protein n=1 Tax=Bacillus sp. Marseille-P3661 TaxID=1936234 RepID=UPI000C841BB8|nr:FapA family protein [Bacillus sp. Marseille-P3661]
MQSIISKGKDINEAILLGLNLLETTKKEVNIEIIEHGVKRFFGIRSKQAIVKLTKLKAKSVKDGSDKKFAGRINLEDLVIAEVTDNRKDEQAKRSTKEKIESTSQKLNRLEQDTLEGKAWIEDGQLYFKCTPTQFPQVTTCSGVKLFKNGQIVKEKTIVLSEKDSYQLVVNGEEKETRWKITLDKHNLHVYLHVEPGYKINRTIVDLDSDSHLKIRVEETKEINNTLKFDDIIDQLALLRVVHGFNHAEIIKAIETKEACTYEIATGIEPQLGTDGWIEINVETNPQQGFKENEDGIVDFREITTIPTVDRGQIIGTIHPPTPGQCGYTVTNEPLLIKQTLPVILNKGKGIMVVDDKLVATESGRPLIEKRGRLIKASIMPKLTLTGNVDLTSGNVHFNGDVEILGSVEAEMLVETEGNIIVHNEVYMATLTASGAIMTNGNIIGSKISAGKNNMLIADLGNILEEIHQETERIIAIIKQLTQSKAYLDNDFTAKGLQPLIRVLIEKKFRNFPALIKKYIKTLSNLENQPEQDEWKEIGSALTSLLLPVSNYGMSLDEFIQLSTRLKQLHEMSKVPIEPDSFIKVPNVLNSRLYCSGDIWIMGEGCVNSKLHAGGHLNIIGTIRGGVVYGQLGVQINEVGAEIGTPTFIEVPSNQIISINKAMEGTTIKIGYMKHTFTETRYLVKAYIDQNNKLIIE